MTRAHRRWKTFAVAGVAAASCAGPVAPSPPNQGDVTAAWCNPADAPFDASRAAALTSAAPADAAYDACGLDRSADQAAPGTRPRYVAGHDYLEVWNGRAYEPIFLRGVNLGLGIPGSGPSDFAIAPEQYERWLQKMTDLGVNVLRVYTLHPPAFYRALAAHNCKNPSTPIYLLHGIWLGDPDLSSAESSDLHASSKELDTSIEEVIDSVHGARKIAARSRQAYGSFTTDVSPWIIGFLVGREVLSDEVHATDDAHPTETSFSGKALSLRGANPSSVWVTQRLDHAISYERERFGVTRPVAFSNWLETDPLGHPTEAESPEDRAKIDTSKIDVVDAPAGVFASFHVYPYYPDFMSEDPGYRAFTTDICGENSYRGYLDELKRYHGTMPVIVAELGVPSSWGNAKYATNGMHHGGHSEAAQAKFTRRMIENIHDERLAGAVVFGWMDGWFKQVWITRDITDPSRLALWHDLTNPQQSYGLMAFDPGPPDFGALPVTKGTGRIRRVAAAADAEFFHTSIELADPLGDGETLTLGFDTYGDAVGESILPDHTRTRQRSELALTITAPTTAQLRVTQAYDLYGIGRGLLAPGSLRHSTQTDGGAWFDVKRNNGLAHVTGDGRFAVPATDQLIGALVARREGDAASTLDAVVIGASRVDVRIPWSLLQFSDPSRLRVVDDDPATPDVYETATSAGIGVAVALGGELVETPRLAWAGWESAPSTTERYRPVAAAVSAAFAETKSPLPGR